MRNEQTLFGTLVRSSICVYHTLTYIINVLSFIGYRRYHLVIEFSRFFQFILQKISCTNHLTSTLYIPSIVRSSCLSKKLFLNGIRTVPEMRRIGCKDYSFVFALTISRLLLNFIMLL
jgi:hypothetical protein